jgi:hypothetical protein
MLLPSAFLLDGAGLVGCPQASLIWFMVWVC